MDKNILYTAIQAALAAGAEIMSVYTDPKADFEIEKKADNSPLTIADRKSHAIIAQALAATPYPVLSEEGAKIAPEVRQQWKELWVVDPLDGTKEFIKRNGEFTVNIAYVKNGCPEAGVIYIPVKQELYFAIIANLNNKKQNNKQATISFTFTPQKNASTFQLKRLSVLSKTHLCFQSNVSTFFPCA